MADSYVENVTILGSSGSIGQSTLNVLSMHPSRYRVKALSVNTNIDILWRQIEQFSPEAVAVADVEKAAELAYKIKRKGLSVEVLNGAQGIDQIAAQPQQIVVCGIVGSIGLASALAAVDAGNKVLIANKEPLVMLGDYIMQRARQSGAIILPLDSEHNAIFQSFGSDRAALSGGQLHKQIRRILLTGSGGPFRQMSIEHMVNVTPDQACAHPNWSMGQKISVDSATMMNKGLELIEACVLYGVSHELVEIVVHPQSVIHSMVEYLDGSVIAQMATPDMRVPIAHALAWPERIDSGAAQLDFFSCGQFEFYPPDEKRFPALRLARQAAAAGGVLPTVMNAANEIAVEAFLQQRIGFTQIAQLVEQAMQTITPQTEVTMQSALSTDEQTRQFVRSLIVDSQGKMHN